jgi:hypothetical protein
MRRVVVFAPQNPHMIMRLLGLKAHGEFSLTEFVGDDIPPYAILSHTWGADDEEVTFKDLMDGTGKSKAGYIKIRFCGKQAASRVDSGDTIGQLIGLTAISLMSGYQRSP